MPNNLEKARKRRAIAAQIRPRLVEAYPNCFAAKGQPKRPLKIGIYHDLKGKLPGVTNRHLHYALCDYVWGPTYQRAMVEGAHRVDLDGFPAGTVSAGEAGAAAAKLRKFDKWAAQDRKRTIAAARESEAAE